nr:receptor like protein kinase S.2 [Ipomoea batatas]
MLVERGSGDAGDIFLRNPCIDSWTLGGLAFAAWNESEILGSGGFGMVYRVVMPSDETVVAVKYLAERGERFEMTFALRWSWWPWLISVIGILLSSEVMREFDAAASRLGDEEEDCSQPGCITVLSP